MVRRGDGAPPRRSTAECAFAALLIDWIEQSYEEECSATHVDVPLESALAKWNETYADNRDWYPWVKGMELLPALRRLLSRFRR